MTPFCSCLMEACEIPLRAINGTEHLEVPISLQNCLLLQVPCPKPPPLATFQSCYLRCRCHLKAFLSPQWRVVLPDCHTVMLCGARLHLHSRAKFDFIEVNVFLVVTYLLFKVLILFQMLY